MSLGYNSRLSQIGIGKADPVGSGGTKVRPAEDSIVAQIQPRNSTPLQSSSISRSMVSADVGDSGLGLSVKEGIPQSFMGSSVKSPTDAGLANESLSRLSISGRLSLGQPPATPVARNRQSITNLLSAPTPTVSVEEGKKGLDAPPTTGRSELIRDRFASVDRTTTVIAPVEPKDSLISVDTAMGKPGPALSNQPLEAPRNGHISVNPSLSSSSMTSSATNGLTTSNSGNIPQLIKGLVERSITDAMAEIRNDIQNLHVELIKQSLAQQNALHQIVANMPDMYKKLSDEYRVLQEENERLKLRLSLENSPPELTIKLDGDRPTRKRVLSGGPGSREIQSVEQCSIVQDGESLSGRLIIRQKPGQTLEHQGVHIEFIGAVERHGETTSAASKKDIFQCSRVQLLAPMGDAAISKETVILEFDFGPLRMPFESYDGTGISLRYYLRAVLARKMTDITKETTLWCCRGRGTDASPTTGKTTSPSLSTSPPVELEVGLEEFLHIKLQLGRSRYTFNDEIRGLLRFLMVRVRIVDVEVNLVRKEVGVDDLLIQQTILTSKQLMDGPAHRGDQIPMQLDLASIADRLTATMEAVNKMFSIRYYVGVILRDTEGRKYYKQVEIELVKGAELSPYLPNFKLGLTSH